MNHSKELLIKSLGVIACILVMVSCFLPIYTLPFLNFSKSLISAYDVDSYTLMGLALLTLLTILFAKFHFLSTVLGIYILAVVFNIEAQRDFGYTTVPDLGISVLVLVLCALVLISYPFIYKRNLGIPLIKLDSHEKPVEKLGPKEDFVKTKTIFSIHNIFSTVMLNKIPKKYVFLLLVSFTILMSIFLFEAKKGIDRKSALVYCIDQFEVIRDSAGVPHKTKVATKKVTPLTKLLNGGDEWKIYLHFTSNLVFEGLECTLTPKIGGGINSDLNWVTK